MTGKPVLLFFGFWYFIPFLFTFIYRDFTKELYRGDIDYFSLIYSTLFCLLIYLFSKIRLGIPDIKQFRYLSILFSNKIEWFLILVFFITSIIFSIEFGVKFRQSGEYMSQAGVVVYLNTITKTYVKLFLFKSLILFVNNVFDISKTKIFFVLIGSILSISASLDAIIIFFSFFLLINSKIIITNKVSTLLFYFFPILLMIISVPIIGTVNKIGIEETFIRLNENALLFLKITLRRISTWQHSINIYLDYFKEYFPYFEYRKGLVSDILTNLYNRLEILFGGTRELTGEWSSSRSNYLNLFWSNTNPRSGTSPGIIATSLMISPIFSFIFLSFITGLYYKFVYKIIGKNINIIFHGFVLFIIISPFVSAPLDLINFINPSIIFFVFLVALKYHLKKIKSQQSSFIK